MALYRQEQGRRQKQSGTIRIPHINRADAWKFERCNEYASPSGDEADNRKSASPWRERGRLGIPDHVYYQNKQCAVYP